MSESWPEPNLTDAAAVLHPLLTRLPLRQRAHAVGTAGLQYRTRHAAAELQRGLVAVTRQYGSTVAVAA
jgi:hypothetical protein